MRKLLFSVITLLAFSVMINAQKKETIEGNGKIVTRDVTVSSFDKLKASGIYELKLSQGNKESVKIEADENLQEYFTVRNEGSELVIEMKKLEDKNMNIRSKLRVYVTFTRLKELNLSTIGDVNSTGSLSFDDLALKTKSVGNVDLELNAKNLDFKNTSVGNIDLSGKAQSAVIKNSGVGNVDAGSFVVQTVDIDNTGVGNVTVNAEKELKVKDSSLGKVSNKGNARMKKTGKVKV